MEDAHGQGPRFDDALGAWILSRHADVGAALRDRGLSGVASAAGAAAHRALRDAMARAFSGERLEGWRAGLERSARERAAALPTNEPVDLLATFAAPWALELAITVTGAAPSDGARLAGLARNVLLAAAFRTEADAGPDSHAPVAELARRLPPADAVLNVQAFVALSQTLPHLLGAMWLELFGRPEAAARLRANPRLLGAAIEELFRLANPSQAVFRLALADVHMGEATICRGERVILRLAAADRDPVRHAQPDRLELGPAARHHYAFGAGVHACSGARLVRAAAAAATDALLRSAGAVELVGDVTWLEGYAMRAPASLPAVLRPALARPQAPPAS